MNQAEANAAKRTIRHIFTVSKSNDIKQLYADYQRSSKSSSKLPTMSLSEFYEFIVDNLGEFYDGLMGVA